MITEVSWTGVSNFPGELGCERLAMATVWAWKVLNTNPGGDGGFAAMRTVCSEDSALCTVRCGVEHFSTEWRLLHVA